MASLKAIGEVRPSQLITTFGPGAVVDVQTTSIIVAGIDSWPRDPDLAIHEPRLQRALHVEAFYAAKASEGSFFNRRGTVPAYIFPRYQVCPVEGCRMLSSVDEGLLEYVQHAKEFQCKAPGCPGWAKGKRRAATLPAPFVVACPGGHIDDFPWRSYVHGGATSCKQRLKLYSIGQTGAVSDLWVECGCGDKKSMSGAFGEQQSQAIGPCTRRRPWLGMSNVDTAACSFQNDVRALQRGATNGWFPVVRSALVVKEAATPIGQALARCSPRHLEKITSLEALRTFVQFEDRLAAFRAEEVWETLLKVRGQAESSEAELRWPEWLALKAEPDTTGDEDELFLERGDIPPGFTEHISRVVRVRKLLEVRALTGFTRIEPPAASIDTGAQYDIAPIFREARRWLPAVEVRGEGLFLELNEESVANWEKQCGVENRSQAMAKMFEEWEKQRGGRTTEFPGARYVLLHSLAHAMIRQIALDCGYSASSIRERVYCSREAGRRMAGVLLYTASPDSEGSLGGLVDLGKPSRFPTLLENAIRSVAQCSSDPLCADHQPDAHASINAAACHACLLASETSCEAFNRFLDRSVLSGTMATDLLAFFPR